MHQDMPTVIQNSVQIGSNMRPFGFRRRRRHAKVRYWQVAPRNFAGCQKIRQMCCVARCKFSIADQRYNQGCPPICNRGDVTGKVSIPARQCRNPDPARLGRDIIDLQHTLRWTCLWAASSLT